MTSRTRKFVLFGIALVLSLAADQLSKRWARESLRYRSPPDISVIHNYWEFRYSENTGSAFGLFRELPGGPYLLNVAGILILGWIGFGLRRTEAESPWIATAYGLIAGGAIGNIVDRFLYGRVTDFIVWYFVDGSGKRHEWYTFNVADAAIVAGVIPLVLFWPRKAPEKPD